MRYAFESLHIAKAAAQRNISKKLQALKALHEDLFPKVAPLVQLEKTHWKTGDNLERTLAASGKRKGVIATGLKGSVLDQPKKVLLE